jgi:multidrug efflux pump subunit AcrA (membrane-fusion protein)
MKTIFFVTVLLSTAFVLLMYSCHKSKNEEMPKVTVTVKLAAVQKGPIELLETAPGRTDVEKREKILSPVAGRVIQQTKQPGAEVSAGEIIAVIRTKESDVALTGAQTLLSEAQTEDQKMEAQRTLKLAEESQNSLSLKAPFKGVIISRATNVNELVSENSELYTMIDLSTLNFIADVPLATAVRLHPGQRGSIRFDALPNEVLEAFVTDISGQADPESQNVKVRFKFKDLPSRFAALKTDMPGVVRILTGIHPNALLVPKVALLRNDETNSYSLTTITHDSLSITVSVTIGVSNDSMTEITGGNIQEGMPVLTEGYYGLADSTRITTAR